MNSPPRRAGFRTWLREAIGLPEDRKTLIAVLSMMGLYFLVVLTLGMMRPVRHALALDGLAEGDFYQVYLVSALVILFVPLVNRLSNRIPWRRLIPALAVFFAVNLLLFRMVYQDGSTAFGLAFYGWYDLFAASLVAQFFMVSQLFFHARLAKNAYPIVIAGGSLGATAGALVTGSLAELLGTPNLLLVAMVPVLTFAFAVPFVWRLAQPDTAEAPRRRKKQVGEGRDGKGQLKAIVMDRQVQLIAGLVLITILVKQIVDYQFNEITKLTAVDRDAIARIQGWFYAATQWLPLVGLVIMKPLLKRWGVGLVVLLLPVAMLSANAALLAFWGIWAGFAAKAADNTFRYSVERAGREILYVPVPDEIKLKAKNYIDAALEKGVGKISSALLLFILIGLVGFQLQQVAWVGLGLAAVWILMALRVRKEYVKALARSVEQRFASLRGGFASLSDPATVSVIRDSLGGDDRTVAFALDLLDDAAAEEVGAFVDQLQGLLDHPLAEIRRRALVLLARAPGGGDAQAVRTCLHDPEPPVREAAVRALFRWAREEGTEGALLEELLSSDQAPVRSATLVSLARGELDVEEGLAGPELFRRAGLDARVAGPAGTGSPAPVSDLSSLTPDERIERALVAAALRPPDAGETLERLMVDPDSRVAAEAIRSAGMLGDPELHPRLVAALANPRTREAARDALASLGTEGLPVLVWSLLDEQEDPAVRRHLPSLLSRIPAQETVPALVRCILAPETEQVLDHRAVKALSTLRARHPELEFDPEEVDRLLEHSLSACLRYAETRAVLDGLKADGDGPPLPLRLLRQAVTEAWDERREEVFRALGLRFTPDQIHRCYLAVVRGEQVPRANALEWLETTLGYRSFRRLEPILDREVGENGAPPRSSLEQALESLEDEQDRWIAHLALETRKALGLPPSDAVDPYGDEPKGTDTMNLVETVFLLQQIDILQDARSDHLALLAGIAEEVDVPAETALLREGEPGEALYVVIRGTVALSGAGGDLVLKDGRAFGTWALIDEVPSMVGAVTTEPTRLLRIGREEYYDLLTDHPELAIGMLQGLARRIRTLVA